MRLFDDQFLKETDLQFQPVILFSCHLTYSSALDKSIQHTSVNNVMIVALSLLLDSIADQQPLLSHQEPQGHNIHVKQFCSLFYRNSFHWRSSFPCISLPPLTCLITEFNRSSCFPSNSETDYWIHL